MAATEMELDRRRPVLDTEFGKLLAQRHDQLLNHGWGMPRRRPRRPRTRLQSIDALNTEPGPILVKRLPTDPTPGTELRHVQPLITGQAARHASSQQRLHHDHLSGHDPSSHTHHPSVSDDARHQLSAMSRESTVSIPRPSTTRSRLALDKTQTLFEYSY